MCYHMCTLDISEFSYSPRSNLVACAWSCALHSRHFQPLQYGREPLCKSVSTVAHRRENDLPAPMKQHPRQAKHTKATEIERAPKCSRSNNWRCKEPFLQFRESSVQEREISDFTNTTSPRVESRIPIRRAPATGVPKTTSASSQAHASDKP
jgi:hypothetical protein